MIEWWAEAVKMIFSEFGIGWAWNAQCGELVAFPQTASGFVPSGRMAHRFWCVTASRSM